MAFFISSGLEIFTIVEYYLEGFLNSSLYRLAIFGGFLLTNIVLAYMIIFFEHHHLHEENGVMENAQALLLGAGTVIYLKFFLADRNENFFYGALSLLCFSFLLRELDVEDFSLPIILIQLGSGTGRNIMLFSLWCLMAYGFVFRIEDKFLVVHTFIKGRLFRYLQLTLLLLIVSAIFDRRILVLQHSRLFEELFEINAYLMLLAPILHRWLSGSAFRFTARRPNILE